ncbi:hypothetical protein PG990_009322 [Apiospora arundinis]
MLLAGAVPAASITAVAPRRKQSRLTRPAGGDGLRMAPQLAWQDDAGGTGDSNRQRYVRRIVARRTAESSVLATLVIRPSVWIREAPHGLFVRHMRFGTYAGHTCFNPRHHAAAGRVPLEDGEMPKSEHRTEQEQSLNGQAGTTLGWRIYLAA